MPDSKKTSQINSRLDSRKEGAVASDAQTHYEFQSSHEKIEQILEWAQLGTWDLDLKKQTITFDSRWARLLGYSIESIGNTVEEWQSRIHPMEQERVWQSLQDSIVGKSNQHECIHRMLHADGHWIWVLERGRISGRAADGTPLTFTVTTLDISQYKNQEGLSSEIQKMANIGAWELDTLTNKTIWTDQTYHIHAIPLGTPTDKIMGIEFYPPVERTRLVAHLEACQNGQSFVDTFEFIAADGVNKWVEVMGNPVRDAMARVVRIQGTFQDVTIRKQSELEALDREQSLNSLYAQSIELTKQLGMFFDISIGLLCIADSKGYFNRINPSFIQLLGYSEEQLLATPIVDLIHPEDVESTKKEMHSLSEGKLTVNFKNRYRKKDGSYILLSWNSAADLTTGLIYAAARDITEETQKQLELEQVLRAVSHSSLISATDLDGKITEVNDLFCAVSGYEPHELLGQDHRILNSGAHSKSYIENLWFTIKAGQIWTGKFQNKKKDGSFYYVNSVITPIKDHNQQTIKYLSIRNDLTEQVQSEKQLENAQTIAHIGSFQFSPITHDLLWSPELYRIFSIPVDHPKAQLYELYLQRIHPDDRDRVILTISNSISEGIDYKIDHRLLLPDGTVRYIHALAQVSKDRNGNVILIQGTAQDATESYEIQKSLELEKTKSLHNAKLASLGEMSAGIAHEINNPLAIIMANIPLLLKFKDDPVKFETKSSAITKSAQRIEKIVKGLRRFSRSSEESPRKPENTLSLIEEALILVEAKAKQHSTSISFSHQIRSNIVCNIVEIEQVLVNLISNSIDAVKHLPEKWVQISVIENGQKTVFRITDSGHGISSELEQKIFQPFFTTKIIGEGTGLGLSISKSIIEDHGGSLTIVPHSPNTCFEFTIPNNSKEVSNAN